MRRQPTEAILIGALVVSLAGIGAISLLPERPPHPERATITGVSFVVTRFSVHEHVAFRSADGRSGTASFLPDQFSCHVGDTVEAEEVGVNLRLRPGACRRPPPSPWAAPAKGQRNGTQT